MKKPTFKKPTLKRMLFGSLQHLLAGVLIMVAVIVALRLQIHIENAYGSSAVYELDPFEQVESFEDTQVFKSLLHNKVSAITRLVVIKGQIETNGVYNRLKEIDVTAFASRREAVRNCPITAVYYLDDLLKWGRDGLGTVERRMAKSDFVQYFDPEIIDPENFYLLEDNNLQYRGQDGGRRVVEVISDEVIEAGTGTETGIETGTVADTDTETVIETDTVTETGEEAGTETGTEVEVVGGMIDEEQEGVHDAEEGQLLQVYESYTQEDLIEIVYQYIMSRTDRSIERVIDASGTETVAFSVLRNRYLTVDGIGQMTELADNWIDYFALERNIQDTVMSLLDNYEEYQANNGLFAENATNLKYMVSIPRGEEWERYSNLPYNIRKADEDNITAYFQKLGRYVMYVPHEMEFYSNIGINEYEMYQYISSYEYAYPEAAYIWIGVDTSYPIETDAFAQVRNSYLMVVPNVWPIMLAFAVCILAWLVFAVYLSMTAGRAVDQQGNRILYQTWLDRIWVELLVGLCVFIGIIGYYGFDLFAAIRDGNHQSESYIQEGSIHMIAALYGFLGSMGLNIALFSIVRRIKSRTLWKYSFIRIIFIVTRKVSDSVFYHKSAGVRALIPYNIFLFVNLLGLGTAYYWRRYPSIMFPILVSLLVFDSLAGVVLTRRSMAIIEIVEGLKKLREGDVDYHLDASGLRGDYKEMAEAVNNIGEGIRKAVESSMKDEKMKADLITNVSHDIKTPLTSIINYVDLLKREKIEDEPAKGYIEILDSKAKRLKQLTDDLVEASKISSGNIELEWEMINFTELLNQAIGEFTDKFQETNLTIVFEDNESAVFIYADSGRMWRVVENLFFNVCKYSMPDSRVYIDIQSRGGLVEVSLKNISYQQLNIRSDELTERFIRGDLARTSEGSGLGLSIAKSLTEAQGGSFLIYLDGDLFKVVLCFPEHIPEEGDSL